MAEGPSRKSLYDRMLANVRGVLVNFSPEDLTESRKGSKSMFGSLGLEGPFDFMKWCEILRRRLSGTISMDDNEKRHLALAMILVLEPTYMDLFGGEDGGLNRLLMGLELVFIEHGGGDTPFVPVKKKMGRPETPTTLLRKRLTKKMDEAFNPTSILRAFCPQRGITNPLRQYRTILSRYLHPNQADYLDKVAHLPTVILAFDVMMDPLKKKFYDKRGMRGILELEFYRVTDYINKIYPGHLPIAYPKSKEWKAKSTPLETVRETTEDLMLEVQFKRIISSIETEANINLAITKLHTSEGAATLDALQEAATMMNAQYVEIMDHKNKGTKRNRMPAYRKNTRPGLRGTAFIKTEPTTD